MNKEEEEIYEKVKDAASTSGNYGIDVNLWEKHKAFIKELEKEVKAELECDKNE